MSAIPKPDRDPTMAANLRPIAVSSVWYRLAMRIFIARFTGELPGVYSLDQHGFCPSRNAITALHNVACTVEYGLGKEVPVYLL